ncbi:hypothetical protein GCM10027514_40550 [Azotobacter armeniacus]
MQARLFGGLADATPLSQCQSTLHRDTLQQGEPWQGKQTRTRHSQACKDEALALGKIKAGQSHRRGQVQPFTPSPMNGGREKIVHAIVLKIKPPRRFIPGH